MKSKSIYVLLLVTFLVLLACSGLSTLEPTSTPVPTSTQVPTPIPTVVTSTPVSALLTDAANVPDGFAVQEIAGFPLSVLVPEGWYFLQEELDGVDAFFVTKESIETFGRFTTGLTVNIVQQDIQRFDVDASASGYIDAQASAETTTRIVTSEKLQSDDGSLHLYFLMIEASLPVDPKDPVAAPEKTLVYQAIADTNTGLIYLMIFESPRETWDEEFKNNGSQLIFSVTELIFQGR